MRAGPKIYELNDKQKELVTLNSFLVDRHIYFFLSIYKITLDSERADCLKSNLYISLMQSAYSFDPARGRKFSSYVIDGFKLAAMKFIANEQADKLTYIEESEEFDSPNDIIEDEQRHQILQNRSEIEPDKILSVLTNIPMSEKEKTFVILRYARRYSYKAISKIMDLSNIRTVYYFKDKIMNKLESYCNQHDLFLEDFLIDATLEEQEGDF